MIIRRAAFSIACTASLALAACGENPEAVEGGSDMELAEDTDEGTVADQMNSGPAEIREGGGRAVGGADNPNEPVIPEDTEVSDTEPGDVR